MKCIVNPKRLLIVLSVIFNLQNLNSTDLEALLEGLHNSSWIKSQSNTNKQLVQTISKDIPRAGWEINYGRETQPGEVEEETFSIAREFNSAWLSHRYQKQAHIDAESQDLEYIKYVAEKEIEVEKAFYEALHLQNEIELRQIFTYSLDSLLKDLKELNNHQKTQLKQEHQLESSQIFLLQAELADKYSKLMTLCQLEHGLTRLTGSIRPEWSNEIYNSELQKLDQNFNLIESHNNLKSLKIENEQLQDKLFKTFSIELGTKRVNEPDMKGSGQVLGISTPIPMAYVNRRQRQRTRLLAKFKTSQFEEHRFNLKARLRSLSTLITQTIKHAKKQESLLIDDATKTFKEAEKAFLKGEAELGTLIDAARYLLDCSFQVVEAENKARQHYLEFKILLKGVGA